MRISYLFNIIFGIILTISSYNSYKKSISNKKHTKVLKKIDGFKSYKWGMDLPSVLKIKDCDYLFLRTATSTSPAKLSFKCDSSVLFDQPVLGEMRFRSQKLSSIKFKYLLNQKTVDMYQEFYATDIKSAQFIPDSSAADYKLDDNLEYVFVKPEVLKQALNLALHNKNFVDIYESAKEVYGRPKRYFNINQDLKALFETATQDSEPAYWQNSSDLPSLRTSYISIHDGEKIAHLALRGPKNN
jgi:hypothetical protein